MTKAIAILLSVFVAQFTFAQSDSIFFSIDIDSVYITSSTGIGRAERNISANTLNQNPIQNISSAINEVPGVYMHSGTLNTNRITVRGIGNRSLFSTTKLRTYIDDIPLTNGVGETTIEDFDKEIFRSVDVFKGPGATAYGSGLGGLLLLNTDSHPNQNYLKTQIVLGDYGFIKNNQVASFSNQIFNLKLLQSYQHTDGYRENNSYDNRNYSIFGGVNYGDHRLSVLLHHININAQIPSSLDRDDFDSDPQKGAFTWARIKGYEDYTKTVAGATFETSAIDKLYFKSTVFANIYKGFESRPFNILDDESVNGGLRSSVSYIFGDRRNIEFQLGFEISKEQYNWNLYETESGEQKDLFQRNKEERSSTQLFAVYSMDLTGNLRVEIGLNANRTTYNLRDQFSSDSIDISGRYDYRWIYSPRLNIKYTIDEFDYIYGLISHGYSIPTLEETLTPEGIINNSIRPEVGINAELGYRGTIKSKALSYGVVTYWMEVKDLLVARRTDIDQFIGINAGGSRHIGVEVDLNYGMLQNDNWSSDIDLSYTYQRFTFTDFLDGDNDYSGNQLTGAIPNQLSMGWNGGYKGWCLSVKYKYVDRMPMRDDNSIYSDAYTLMDAFVSKSFTLGKLEISANVGLNNLLNTKYASMILINAGAFGGNAPRYFYPGLPFNSFIKTSFKYNF